MSNTSNSFAVKVVVVLSITAVDIAVNRNVGEAKVG